MYVLADYDSSMNFKLWYSYTELIEKYMMSVWPRLNIKNLKDVGKLVLNITYP